MTNKTFLYLHDLQYIDPEEYEDRIREVNSMVYERFIRSEVDQVLFWEDPLIEHQWRLFAIKKIYGIEPGTAF